MFAHRRLKAINGFFFEELTFEVWERSG